MTSIKLKFRPSVVEGKKGVIYFQVIQNRVIRQVHTSYQIHAEDWDDNTKSIMTDHPGREEELKKVKHDVDLDMKRLEATIDIMTRRGKDFTADEIVDFFPQIRHKVMFSDYMKEEIEDMKKQGRLRTAETYTTTLYSFNRFLNNREILLNEISSKLIEEYEQSLLNSGVTKNSTSFYMRILRAAYNRAVKEGLIEQENPFKNVYTGIDVTVKYSMTEEQLKAMKAIDLSAYPELAFARDMFMFSFYTRGMAFIDAVFLKKTDFIEGSIVYRRHKNAKKVYIKWEPCMQEVINQYKSSPDSPFVLNVLTEPSENHRKQYKYALFQINKDLKIIGEKLGLSFPLTMNVARHSWASIAQKKNIDLTIICEGLGQKSEEATRLYLSSLKNPEIDKANELIIKDI